MPTIRRATLDDLPVLIRLRIALFRDMGALHDDEGLEPLTQSLADYFSADLRAERFLAWLSLDDSGEPIGCGGLVFVQKPPGPGNLSGREAYLMNMYTVPEWRGRGVATQMMSTILAFVRESGVTSVRLHATEQGRPIYERAGFRATGTEMVLKI